MAKIYVVMGTCERLSDQAEWPVRAFTSQAAAVARVCAASARARELAGWRNGEGIGWPYVSHRSRPKNDYDPGMQMRRPECPPNYIVYEVDLDSNGERD